MRDKNQQGILTKAEIELIKNTFGGEGEELLYHIRNVFLQFPVKETKKFNQEVLDILQKYIIPEPSPDFPLKSQSDLYFSLDTLKQIPPEVAYTHIKAMDLMVEYLEQRFAVLKGALDNGLELKSLKQKQDKSDEDRFIDMIAYQTIPAYVESSLDRLRMIANSPEETEEERRAKIQANSSK